VAAVVTSLPRGDGGSYNNAAPMNNKATTKPKY